MAQIISIVVNKRENDWGEHLHVECSYNNSINAAGGLAPNKIHIRRLPRLRILKRPNTGGHKSSDRDIFAYYDLAVACQHRAYDLVHEYHAIAISRVERQNLFLANVLGGGDRFAVDRWAWLYKNAAIIRPGLRKETDESVLKAKLSPN